MNYCNWMVSFYSGKKKKNNIKKDQGVSLIFQFVLSIFVHVEYALSHLCVYLVFENIIEEIHITCTSVIPCYI